MSITQDKPTINRLAAFFNSPEPERIAGEERNHAGRFKNGNRGGPGNPFARRVAKLRQAMLEECAEEDLRAVTRAMLELAKSGDIAAAKLVYQYTLGKPTKIVDPDRIDEDELNVMKGIALPPAMFETMLNALPADTVNTLLQGIWPAMIKGMQKAVLDQMEEQDRSSKETDEMEAEYEALPAEEKLKFYAAGGLTPPDELVAFAEKERAARQQTADPASRRRESVGSSPPSPIGDLSGDKFINLSQKEGKQGPVPSPNGVSAPSNGVSPSPNGNSAPAATGKKTHPAS